MKPLRSGFCALAIAGLGMALASCGTESYHQKEERYVLVTTNVNLPYWQEANAGLMDAAKWLGVKSEISGPEKFSPEDELS